jgi:hypothetical protein
MVLLLLLVGEFVTPVLGRDQTLILIRCRSMSVVIVAAVALSTLCVSSFSTFPLHDLVRAILGTAEAI